MRVVIAVATADEALRAYLATARSTIVPPDVLAQGYLHERQARFSVQLQAISQATTSADLGRWLRRVAMTTDGLILLVDDAQRHLVQDYEDAYFIVGLPAYPGKVLQNQVRSALAPILRHFISYSQRFDNLGNQRVLLLPLDVFEAAELAALRTRLTHQKMLPGFGSDLDDLMAALHRRSRPKSRKRFRRVYLVDDRPLWYRYGPEEHKIVQTVVPPHHEKCWHNSRFRFGRLYNDRPHHNIDDDSVPTSVYGTFVTCHGDMFTATGESHLNMFPNGFL